MLQSDFAKQLLFGDPAQEETAVSAKNAANGLNEEVKKPTFYLNFDAVHEMSHVSNVT